MLMLLLYLQEYIVVDASEDEVLVAVHHQNTTNLYVSETTGIKYSLSLENILSVAQRRFSQRTYLIDIHRVSDIEQRFILMMAEPGSTTHFQIWLGHFVLSLPCFSVQIKNKNCKKYQQPTPPKFSLRAFIWVVTHLGFTGQLWTRLFESWLVLILD